MAMDRSVTNAAYLNVTVNGKPAKMAVAKMSDTQLKQALLMPENKGSLAPGWVVSGGSIVKSAAPAAPVAPPIRDTPQPTITPPGGPGTDKPPIPADPVGGYLKVRQKQANGTWKVVLMHRSKLSPAQIDAAMKSGLNGPVPGAPSTPAPGGAQPAAPSTPAPSSSTPVAGTTPAAAAPSWIPPMVGLGGLNADPNTGKIDWSKIISAANEISAVDPQYAQDLSNNIWTAMQGVAPMQAEIQSLTTIDPTTGKTLYQSLFDNAQRKYKQDTSKTFGTTAARGIGSSGMVNSTLANQTAANATEVAGFGKQYGNQRISELLGQMTGQLAQQDTNFTSSYYGALSRAQQGIPNIPTPS